MSSPVYADEVSVEYSSENIPEGYIGMIVDKNGNIKELIPMPISRETPYVDKIVTIEPDDSYISYQYESKNHFVIGFGFYPADYRGDGNNYATTPDRMLRFEIHLAYSIGGTRHTVRSQDFSTNFEDRYQYSSFLNGENDTYIELVHEGNFSGVYFNGVITNMSSQSANVRVRIFSV